MSFCLVVTNGAMNPFRSLISCCCTNYTECQSEDNRTDVGYFGLAAPLNGARRMPFAELYLTAIALLSGLRCHGIGEQGEYFFYGKYSQYNSPNPVRTVREFSGVNLPSTPKRMERLRVPLLRGILMGIT